jgi:hypothetical protein
LLLPPLRPTTVRPDIKSVWRALSHGRAAGPGALGLGGNLTGIDAISQEFTGLAQILQVD